MCEKKSKANPLNLFTFSIEKFAKTGEGSNLVSHTVNCVENIYPSCLPIYDILIFFFRVRIVSELSVDQK